MSTRSGQAILSARRRKGRDADAIDGFDECVGAAVHDRRFDAVELDEGIVHPKPAQGRHDVFDGRHDRTRGVAQNGREIGCAHRARAGADLAAGLPRPAGANEDNAGAGRRGVEGQGDWRAGMHSGAAHCDQITQRGLSTCFHQQSLPQTERQPVAAPDL